MTEHPKTLSEAFQEFADGYIERSRAVIEKALREKLNIPDDVKIEWTDIE